MSIKEEPEESNSCSIPDAANRLGVSLKIVRRYIAGGQLKASREKGNWKVDVDSLEALVRGDGQIAEGFVRDLFGKIVPSKRFKTPVEKRQPDQVNWVDISDTWKKPGRSGFTFVDLFSGAGESPRVWSLPGSKVCAA